MAIHFDAAAFAGQLALQVGHAQGFAERCRHPAIVAVALLVAPAVEVEVHQRAVAVVVDDKAAAVIADPDVVQCHRQELDVVGAALLACLSQVFGTAEYGDRLVPGDGTGQLRDTAVDRVRLVFPDIFGGGEGQEDPSLGLVFFGHEPALVSGHGQAQRAEAEAGDAGGD
ncbi:hypothetical protein D3C80_889880 [compost metagenome]